MARIIDCSNRKGLPLPYEGPIEPEAAETEIVPRVCPLISKISKEVGDSNKKTAQPRSEN